MTQSDGLLEPEKPAHSQPPLPGRSAKIRFNPKDPVFQANPHATYKKLREQAPLYRFRGTLLLTRLRMFAQV